MILAGFDPQLFLRDHWQREPLLIRHAGPAFVDPIDPDELAGLACETDMEARLVTRGEGETWQLEHGPFKARRFASLPDSNWTLLVQAVDQVDADVDALKRAFDFLPAWRIDDVMVSFASDGGGVGPHFDQYDVFLIQGQGSRTWQVGQRCSATTPLREHSDLSLLQHFETVAEYVLEPGDMLYLPPGVAHHGISRGDSLCYSIGFRAPSLAELIQEFSDAVVATLDENRRFQDPSFQLPIDEALIPASATDLAFSKVATLLGERSCFIDAFGSFVTRPRYPERLLESALSRAEASALLKGGKVPSGLALYRNPASRCAYFADREGLRFYVDGQRFDCHRQQLPLLQALSRTPWSNPLPLEELAASSASFELLISLLEQGSLLAGDADDGPGSDD